MKPMEQLDLAQIYSWAPGFNAEEDLALDDIELLTDPLANKVCTSYIENVDARIRSDQSSVSPQVLRQRMMSILEAEGYSTEQIMFAFHGTKPDQTEISLLDRTAFDDPEHGFRARRTIYRKRFYQIHKRRPYSNTPEDYRLIDWLNEEFGDLIREKRLTFSALKRLNPKLAGRVNTEVIRHNQDHPENKVGFVEWLTTPRSSVREALDQHDIQPT